MAKCHSENLEASEKEDGSSRVGGREAIFGKIVVVRDEEGFGVGHKIVLSGHYLGQ